MMLSAARRSISLRCRAGGLSRRWLHGGASAALSLVAIGCGGDSRLDGPAVDIRGGERLAWTQAATSALELQRLTFMLYVNGSPMQLVAPSCDGTPSGGGFVCSGGLPSLSQGRHTLELTSILDGNESPRSTPLLVNVTGPAAPSSVGAVPAAASASAAAPAGTQSRDDLAGSSVCATGALSLCYTASVLASDLGAIDGMAATPDGRVLFIEAGVRVRVAAPEGLVGEPALVLPDPTARIVGLAAGSDFVESRAVFVAWTQEVAGAGGAGVVNITRYRELGNVLGQGAQIVTGLLTVPAGTVTPMAVDDTGLLYVATPRVTTGSTGETLQEALLLRFDRDGRTPAANPRPSPALAWGLPRPTALAVDPVSRRVWLGDGSVDGPIAASAPPTWDPAAPWPGLLEPADTRAIEAGGAGRPGRLAVSAADPGRSSLMLLSAGDRLWLAAPTTDGRLDAASELTPSAGVSGLTAGPGGAWYVATSDGQLSRIVQLNPLP